MTGPAKFPPPRILVPRKRRDDPNRARADHRARKRENEWRAYQATWQRPINQLKCSAERFYDLRRNVLVLNRKQAARLLRVGVTSVLNWETGVHPVPFYAYLALLLVSESQHFRLANWAWRHWEFIQRVDSDSRNQYSGHELHITELVNRKTGTHFSPQELDRFYWQLQQAIALESEAITMQKKLEDLTRENTEIRELFRVDAVTAEVQDMRKRVGELLGKINTAAVITLKKAVA